LDLAAGLYVGSSPVRTKQTDRRRPACRSASHTYSHLSHTDHTVPHTSETICVVHLNVTTKTSKSKKSFYECVLSFVFSTHHHSLQLLIKATLNTRGWGGGGGVIGTEKYVDNKK
jgi:hypothetical protein